MSFSFMSRFWVETSNDPTVKSRSTGLSSEDFGCHGVSAGRPQRLDFSACGEFEEVAGICRWKHGKVHYAWVKILTQKLWIGPFLFQNVWVKLNLTQSESVLTHRESKCDSAAELVLFWLRCFYSVSHGPTPASAMQWFWNTIILFLTGCPVAQRRIWIL